MCLIALAWQPDSRYHVVIAANRDERHDRPTAALGRWEGEPSIIAGRDLESGGTWMGVTDDGRFAAITNFRELSPPPPDAPSRGTIVADFLRSRLEPQTWLDSLRERASGFAGFNLFAGTRDTLSFLSNRSEEAMTLEPGIYGLSNGPWGAGWPKVERAIDGMERAIDSESTEEDLLDLLRDRTGGMDDDLPDTGVGPEMERFLSPIFIRGDLYGTRSSTVLTIRKDRSVRIREKSWTPGGELVKETIEWVPG
jgi:uncharacterized protein with NRDE domain